jgi:uncharacterized membrane protein YdcZ (DUF606 family)
MRHGVSVGMRLQVRATGSFSRGQGKKSLHRFLLSGGYRQMISAQLTPDAPKYPWAGGPLGFLFFTLQRTLAGGWANNPPLFIWPWSSVKK